METNNREERALEAMLKEAVEAFGAEEGVKEEMRERLGLGGTGVPGSFSFATDGTQMNTDGASVREGPVLRGEYGRREGRGLIGKGWVRRFVGVAACLGVVALVWWAMEGKGLEQSAYAQLVEAVAGTRAAEWVHMRTEVNGQVVESWVAMGPVRNISKTGGQIKYEDYQTGKAYVYEVGSNTLKIGELGDVPEILNKQSFLELMLGVVEHWKSAGNVEVTEKQETVGGRTLTVFAIAYKKEKGQLAELRVDPKAKRIVSMTMIKELAGQTLSKPMTVELDYPEEGPGDVYAVGVPRDAKVMDLSPGEDVKELEAKVASAVKAFAPNYVAVICTEYAQSSGSPAYRIVYKKNGRYRVEYYSSCVPRDDPGVEDMKAIEAYLAKKPISRVSFQLGEREFAYVSLDQEGKLKVRRSREPGFTGTVEWEAWRYTGIKVTTDFSRSQCMTSIVIPENVADAGLIIKETTSQGTPLGPQEPERPARWRSFYDPQHDFICQRDEYLTMSQAPWLKKPELPKEIQGDPDMLRFKNQFVWTVTEYAKTPEGRWYPRRLREEVESRGKNRADRKAEDSVSTTLVTIHLDTTREIADELMEPEKVKAEVFGGAWKAVVPPPPPVTENERE